MRRRARRKKMQHLLEPFLAPGETVRDTSITLMGRTWATTDSALFLERRPPLPMVRVALSAVFAAQSSRVPGAWRIELWLPGASGPVRVAASFSSGERQVARRLAVLAPPPKSRLELDNRTLDIDSDRARLRTVPPAPPGSTIELMEPILGQGDAP